MMHSGCASCCQLLLVSAWQARSPPKPSPPCQRHQWRAGHWSGSPLQKQQSTASDKEPKGQSHTSGSVWQRRQRLAAHCRDQPAAICVRAGTQILASLYRATHRCIQALWSATQLAGSLPSPSAQLAIVTAILIAPVVSSSQAWSGESKLVQNAFATPPAPLHRSSQAVVCTCVLRR